MGRLTSITHVKNPTTIEALTYQNDAAGNRIKLTRANAAAFLVPTAISSTAYDAANEQTQFNGVTQTFGANGNLTNDGTNTYTWDARNRLTAMIGGATASFSYDGLGRRTSKTINSVTTNYQYDGKDIVAETGATASTYVRGLKIDEPFIRQGATNEFYQTDALGSTLALTDATGAAQTTYTYEPFGKTTAVGASSSAFQYTGRENDGTGLYYYRARFYSSTLQRFVSEDPIEFDGNSINLYVYVLNDPVDFADPTGLVNTAQCGKCPGPMKKCIGKARVLKGNPNLIGKQGAFPGIKVAANSAAVIPQQFGVAKSTLTPLAGQISGVLGGQETFCGVTDVIGGRSPIPGVPVRDALQRLYPGLFIIELVSASADLGIVDVELSIPANLSCPTGTRPQ